MRDWLKDEGALDPNRTLEEELLAATYEARGTYIVLEAKDDFKKRLQRSPDAADGLALAISGHEGAVARAFTTVTLPPREAEVRRSFLDHYRARR